MTIQRKQVRRGLMSLIPEEDSSADFASQGGILNVNIESIEPNPHQPRKHIDTDALEELSASIAEHGILQPILVHGPSPSGMYTIIAGERRFRASKLAGLKLMPCIIRPDVANENAEIALVENLQRQDLGPLEEAVAYTKLMEDFAYSPEDLARKLGKSRSYVVNTMRLLKLPDEVQGLVRERKLSAGHARAILCHKDPVASAHKITTLGLSVREAERMEEDVASISHSSISDNIDPKPTTKRKVKNTSTEQICYTPMPISSNPDMLELAVMLTEKTGTQIQIRQQKDQDSGEIILKFSSMQELDSILAMMNKW